MLSRFSAFLLALVVLISSCSKKEDAPPGTPRASEAVKLELKLKQGETYKLATDMVQKINMDMGGQKMNMDQTMRFEVGMAVTEVKQDGNIVTENTYERMMMKQKMNGPVNNEMEIDTKGDVKKGMMSELLLEQFKKMIGMKYTMEFDKLANLKSTNLAEVMKKMSGGAAKGVEDNMSGSSVPFPANPVKVGETWKGEVTKDLAGTKAKISSSYTLKEVKGDMAIISVDGKILKEDGKEMGSLTGTFDVMISNGWTNNATIKMKMDMEVTQQGMKIPMKVDTDMKITSTK
jgi:hypothetical protein